MGSKLFLALLLVFAITCAPNAPDEMAEINKLRSLIEEAKAKLTARKKSKPVIQTMSDNSNTGIQTISDNSNVHIPTISDVMAETKSVNQDDINDLKPMTSLLNAQDHLKQTMLKLASQKKYLNMLKQKEQEIHALITLGVENVHLSEDQLKEDSKTLMQTASSFNSEVAPVTKREEKKEKKEDKKDVKAPANDKEMQRFTDKLRLASQALEIQKLKSALIEKERFKEKMAAKAEVETKAQIENPVVAAQEQQERQQKQLLDALHTELMDL